MKIDLPSLALGILIGGVLLLSLLLLALRLWKRPPLLPAAAPAAALDFPDLTLTLSRDFVQHIVTETVRDLAIPLVSLRDAHVELAPDAGLSILVRGDTALLGAQLIKLQLRVIATPDGVRVHTIAVHIPGLGNVAGPLAAQLDQRLNAALRTRLAAFDQFHMMHVQGTADGLTISAQRR